MRALPAVAALTAALVWPAGAFAQDEPGEPAEKPADQPAEKPAPDEGFVGDDDNLRYPPSSARLGLILGGLGLTAAAYGITALVATNWNDVPGADSLYIPVAGPWIALGQSGCAPDDPDCGAILAFRGIMYVLDGIIQAGGVGIAGEGVFMITESDSAPPQTTWTVTPMLTEHTTGIGVAGTF